MLETDISIQQTGKLETQKSGISYRRDGLYSVLHWPLLLFFGKSKLHQLSAEDPGGPMSFALMSGYEKDLEIYPYSFTDSKENIGHKILMNNPAALSIKKRAEFISGEMERAINSTEGGNLVYIGSGVAGHCLKKMIKKGKKSNHKLHLVDKSKWAMNSNRQLIRDYGLTSVVELHENDYKNADLPEEWVFSANAGMMEYMDDESACKFSREMGERLGAGNKMVCTHMAWIDPVTDVVMKHVNWYVLRRKKKSLREIVGDSGIYDTVTVSRGGVLGNQWYITAKRANTRRKYER